MAFITFIWLLKLLEGMGDVKCPSLLLWICVGEGIGSGIYLLNLNLITPQFFQTFWPLPFQFLSHLVVFSAFSLPIRPDWKIKDWYYWLFDLALLDMLKSIFFNTWADFNKIFEIYYPLLGSISQKYLFIFTYGSNKYLGSSEHYKIFI